MKETLQQHTTTSERHFYLDVARVLAILSISLNHAVNRTYDNYNNQMQEFLSISTASTILKTFVTVFSHIGVPLFLMITGVLLLNKRFDTENDLRRFYRHNLARLLITAEIWYIIMFWFIVFVKPNNHFLEEAGIGGALFQMLKTMLFLDQVTMDSMWYMPMILCLYTTIPFAAIVKNKLSAKFMALPLVILFLNSMLLPAVNALLSFHGQPRLVSALREANLCSVYYLYIFTGFLVGCGTLSKFRDGTLIIITTLTFTACCVFQFYAYAQPENYLVNEAFPGILICAALIFECIRRKAHRLILIQKPITYLAAISLGIYFVHILIMSVLTWYLSFDGWRRSLQLLFLEFTSFAGSISIIALLSQISLCKKYLFLIKR